MDSASPVDVEIFQRTTAKASMTFLVMFAMRFLALSRLHLNARNCFAHSAAPSTHSLAKPRMFPSWPQTSQCSFVTSKLQDPGVNPEPRARSRKPEALSLRPRPVVCCGRARDHLPFERQPDSSRQPVASDDAAGFHPPAGLDRRQRGLRGRGMRRMRRGAGAAGRRGERLPRGQQLPDVSADGGGPRDLHGGIAGRHR